ncbi:hypothetical protein HMPREF9946_02446 [Acetobacteraceae bacterium AT-5844]|nr:hypothetical protein HMPREF9946_02446 [Acetobacteraceae bacterium AT-5844]
MTRMRSDNDTGLRERLWQRYPGEEWAAFEALPAAIRHRLSQHSYDGWAVNALLLWRHLRRKYASSARAERRLLRHLDECEALERQAFSAEYHRRHGHPLPHLAAGASVLRGQGKSSA